MPFDPLRHFYKKVGFNQSLINEMVIGEKYTAVILHDGRIGVCATLGNVVERIVPGFKIDFKNHVHRIIFNAYLNAFLNYDNEHEGGRDIFEEVDFSSYKNIVMIGWFRTLHKKFSDSGIKISAFDLLEKNKYLSPLEEMEQTVGEADAIVVSSTTIFNQTLEGINDMVSDRCDIYMLGPSTIMHPDMFKYTRIKALFGSVFKPHDKAVINIIKQGCGTPEFSGHMQKVFLKRP
jgi:uncharacterized protein (DUF4213/DUF364 family)